MFRLFLLTGIYLLTAIIPGHAHFLTENDVADRTAVAKDESRALFMPGNDTIRVDELFNLARKKAHAGETAEARMMACRILEEHPEYYDAFVLAAITLSWEGMYDSARVHLKHVLENHTAHFDALIAIINVEIWDGNYEEAIKYCNTGIDYHYETDLFLFKKGSALRLAGHLPLAIKAIEQVLEMYPDHREAQYLIIWYKMLMNRSMIELFQHNFITFPESLHPELFRKRSYFLSGYHGDFHNSPYERRWHMGSAGYSHYTSFGPVTARINFAQTYFDGRGLTRYPSLQYELESYPVLSKDYYAYAAYAYSGGSSFPKHRGGLELYRNLPRDLEASLGVRYMYRNENFFFYTGSLGKYHGSYWFSIRPYIYTENGSFSHSILMNVRRYLETDGDFAGFSMGRGAVIDERYLTSESRIYLNSWTAGVEISKTFMSDYLFRTGIRYVYEEHDAGSFRGRIVFHAILRYYLSL